VHINNNHLYHRTRITGSVFFEKQVAQALSLRAQFTLQQSSNQSQ